MVRISWSRFPERGEIEFISPCVSEGARSPLGFQKTDSQFLSVSL